MQRQRSDWFYRCSWCFAHGFFKLYCRYEVTGRENCPSEGPVLVVSNHVSYVDPPAVAMVTRRHSNFMAKQELFRIPLLSRVIRALGAFPVARGKPDRAALKHALAALENGEPLIMFPEGTRCEFGKLGEADLGVASIALKSRAPVLPVGLIGTHRAMPRGWPLILPHKVRIRIGRPLTFERFYGRRTDKEELRQVARIIMRGIAEVCGYDGSVRNQHGDKHKQ